MTDMDALEIEAKILVRNNVYFLFNQSNILLAANITSIMPKPRSTSNTRCEQRSASVHSEHPEFS